MKIMKIITNMLANTLKINEFSKKKTFSDLFFGVNIKL